MERSQKSFKKTSWYFVITLMIFICASCINKTNKNGNPKNNSTDELSSEWDADHLMEKSVLINKSGDFYQGFQYLNKAVKLDPKAYLGYRGWIRLRKLRDFEKALVDFNELDRLTPDFVDAPWGEDIDFLRGECHYGKKDYKKAIDSFNLSIKNQGESWVDVQTFVYLGLCEYKLGNYENAIIEFRRALNQSNNICEAHFGLAKTYQHLGKMKNVEEYIVMAEKSFAYKRDDVYNEFLNEIYYPEILKVKQSLNK